ncbi:hypothetical protein IT570_03430 [Candidatus Sumerlaeota bacterium]|nr:hypothetical protein [Candidatus Sumerlaeota bacterium]
MTLFLLGGTFLLVLFIGFVVTLIVCALGDLQSQIERLERKQIALMGRIGALEARARTK